MACAGCGFRPCKCERLKKQIEVMRKLREANQNKTNANNTREEKEKDGDDILGRKL